MVALRMRDSGAGACHEMRVVLIAGGTTRGTGTHRPPITAHIERLRGNCE